MSEETAGPVDLAGVLAEVERLEAIAAELDARLDASRGAGAAPSPDVRGHDGARLVDLREGQPA